MDIHKGNIDGLAITLYGEWKATAEPSATGLDTSTKWADLSVRDHERWRVVASSAIRVLVTAFDQHLNEGAQEREVVMDDGTKEKRLIVDITEDQNDNEG
tara:strand:+ start:2415 stop:2714 length:300 start_codon:yes stop_codon:yes gene_type:complete